MHAASAFRHEVTCTVRCLYSACSEIRLSFPLWCGAYGIIRNINGARSMQNPNFTHVQHVVCAGCCSVRNPQQHLRTALLRCLHQQYMVSEASSSLHVTIRFCYNATASVDGKPLLQFLLSLLCPTHACYSQPLLHKNLFTCIVRQ
jgi:hypothetical protein